MTTLQFSSKQETAFEQSRFQDFRTLMVKQLRETVGGTYALQSDEQLLAYIDKGIAHAKKYGATENDAFGMFIIILTEFGDDFDTNGEYLWASKTLKDSAVKDPNQRVRNLVAQCGFYLSNLDDETQEGSMT